MSAADGTAIRRAAMNLLARREYSQRELRARLGLRFDADELIAAELRKLSAEGLQSDERFTESFVRMHVGRGHGPLRILRELELRGIDDELARAFVHPRDPRWFDMARAWRRRRFGAAPPGDARERARQMRHLQQRGFSHEHVRFAMTAGKNSDDG